MLGGRKHPGVENYCCGWFCARTCLSGRCEFLTLKGKDVADCNTNLGFHILRLRGPRLWTVCVMEAETEKLIGCTVSVGVCVCARVCGSKGICECDRCWGKNHGDSECALKMVHSCSFVWNESKPFLLSPCWFFLSSFGQGVLTEDIRTQMFEGLSPQLPGASKANRWVWNRVPEEQRTESVIRTLSQDFPCSLVTGSGLSARIFTCATDVSVIMQTNHKPIVSLFGALRCLPTSIRAVGLRHAHKMFKKQPVRPLTARIPEDAPRG